MQRRTALAAAAAVTLVLLAGSAAAATSLGLLDPASQTGTVDRVTPQDATVNAPQPDTIIVEPATPPRTSVAERAATVDPEEYDDDDAHESDDDRWPDDEDDHEDEVHGQYEGHDDDD